MGTYRRNTISHACYLQYSLVWKKNPSKHVYKINLSDTTKALNAFLHIWFSRETKCFITICKAQFKAIASAPLQCTCDTMAGFDSLKAASLPVINCRHHKVAVAFPSTLRNRLKSPVPSKVAVVSFMFQYCIVAVGSGELVRPCLMGIHPPLQDQPQTVQSSFQNQILSLSSRISEKWGLIFIPALQDSLDSFRIKSLDKKKAKETLIKMRVLSLKSSRNNTTAKSSGCSYMDIELP